MALAGGLICAFLCYKCFTAETHDVGLAMIGGVVFGGLALVCLLSI